MALHTAGVELNFHPHIHAIALNGTVDAGGAFKMATWKHSGFSSWAGEPIQPNDTEHRLFLSRYMKKAVISNQRLNINYSNPLATTVSYQSGKGEQILSYGFQPGSLVRTSAITQSIPTQQSNSHH